eukprot:6201560-Pleurochrysis_carterae.AAC.4
MHGLPEHKAVADKLALAFNYLENRLTGPCKTTVNCEHLYQVYRAVRVFDPSFASAHLPPSSVDSLGNIPPLEGLVDLQKLKLELPVYLVAARDVDSNDDVVADFTRQMLAFWQKTAATRLAEWRKAARIVFAISRQTLLLVSGSSRSPRCCSANGSCPPTLIRPKQS